MTTDTADIKARRWIEVLLARVDLLERELAEIKTVLSVGSFVRGRQTPPWTGADISPVAASGTGSIRDPGVVAQRQNTGVFGYAPYVPPSE